VEYDFEAAVGLEANRFEVNSEFERVWRPVLGFEGRCRGREPVGPDIEFSRDVG